MPILASNFTSNALQGTVKVSSGFANVNLGVDAFAFEGNKTFVIKLRKDAYNGTVIGTTSTITLYDYSGIVSLAANVSTVNEGNLVGFTLTTSNVPNYTNVFYSILPATANITSSDFVGNTGMITIVNNVGTFALKANADLSLMDETGETFKLQVRTNSATGNIVYVSSNVIIGDVSKGYNVLGFTENGTSTAEGQTLTLTFNATNIPVGTVFNYYTSGNATSSTFTGGNTGSFVMNSTSNTITLLPVGVPYGTTQNFNVVLTTLGYGNVTSVVATSNNLIVVDSAIAYMSATGGTIVDSGGYRLHAFTTSGSLTVSSLGALNTVDYLVVAGGGGGGGGSQSLNYAGGGGGGAGGLLTGQATLTTTGTSTVTVAGGGAGLVYSGSLGGNGGNSSIAINGGATITTYGGGGGSSSTSGLGGGSGGGSSLAASPTAGAGTPGQGYPGGVSSPTTYGGVPNSSMAGGGGGAGGAGSWKSGDSTSAPTSTQSGGIGVAISWAPPAYGTSGPAPGQWFAGGGGGGASPGGSAYFLGGGAGGGGAGGSNNPGYPTSALASGTLASPGSESGGNAIINTGGGGGGVGMAGLASAPPGKSGIGGSGIVLIRYPYTPPPTVNSATTTANAFSIGSNITFTISTTNANLITLYYSTDGNVTTSNFIGGNTGSFVANATGNVFTIQANTNIPLNESRQFRLQIRQDSTTGFISASSANVTIENPAAITATSTAGNVITDTNYVTHVFTAPGTFTVTKVPAAAANATLELLVVGGGGASMASGNSPQSTAGAGAGGYIARSNVATATTYTVIVGAGGNNGAAQNSSFSGGSGSANITYIARGGGFGGGNFVISRDGGSGGAADGNGGANGSGYNFPGPDQQGYPSAAANNPGAGGAGAAGSGNNGGVGLAAPMSPSLGTSYGTPGPGPGRYFAGGGGTTSGGAGGGGSSGVAGVTNTGGGAGAGAPGIGGSGIVIIRYPR